MNKKGEAYCEKQAKRFNKAVVISGKRPEFGMSQIVERIMRMGLEAKCFELELPPEHNKFIITSDLEQVAIASLKESYANQWL